MYDNSEQIITLSKKSEKLEEELMIKIPLKKNSDLQFTCVRFSFPSSDSENKEQSENPDKKI